MNTGYDHLVSRNRFDRNDHGIMEIDDGNDYGYGEVFGDLRYVEDNSMYPLLITTKFTGYLFYNLAIRKKDFTSRFLNLLEQIKPFPSNLRIAPNGWDTFIGDLYYFLLEYCIPEQQLFPKLRFTEDYPNYVEQIPTVEVLERYKKFMIHFLTVMQNNSRDDEYMVLDGEVDVTDETGNPPSTVHNILKYFPDNIPVFVIHQQIYNQSRPNRVVQNVLYINQKKQTIDYSNENEIKFEVDNKGYIVKTTIPKEEYFPHRDIFDAAIKFLAKGPVYEMQNNKDRFITAGFKNTKELQDSIISKAAKMLGFVSKYPS